MAIVFENFLFLHSVAGSRLHTTIGLLPIDLVDSTFVHYFFRYLMVITIRIDDT